MNVTILGCGVYGLALAHSFLENDVKINLWSKFEKEVKSFGEKYLSFNFTTDLKLAIKDSDLIVIAIPVAYIEETIVSLKDSYDGQDILIASKGIDTINQKFAYEIIRDYLGDVPVGAISGGTFAKDMNEKKVMGLTLGTTVASIHEKVDKCLASKFLKIQHTNDLVGVSVCGSIKNVMAIGFGMLDGANYPPSSRFLYLTEAIYEIQKLITILGGSPNTILSYAGIDDIMMTCTSNQSRNYTLGRLLGENCSLEELNHYKETTTIEGLGTAEAIFKLAKNQKIELPLSNMIYQILYEDKEFINLIELLEKGISKFN